jgi:antitoxin (DNA-binding transcriptional repressor) of toxin-antitoxin stability system
MRNQLLGYQPEGKKQLRVIANVATGSYNRNMRSVGIKVLKNKLSDYVRLAASGETVLVTDRDRVVAELVPPRPGRAEQLSDALLADAVRHGLLTPPLNGTEASPPPRKPVARYQALWEELAVDRDDR